MYIRKKIYASFFLLDLKHLKNLSISCLESRFPLFHNFVEIGTDKQLYNFEKQSIIIVQSLTEQFMLYIFTI